VGGFQKQTRFTPSGLKPSDDLQPTTAGAEYATSFLEIDKALRLVALVSLPWAESIPIRGGPGLRGVRDC